SAALAAPRRTGRTCRAGAGRGAGGPAGAGNRGGAPASGRPRGPRRAWHPSPGMDDIRAGTDRAAGIFVGPWVVDGFIIARREGAASAGGGESGVRAGLRARTGRQRVAQPAGYLSAVVDPRAQRLAASLPSARLLYLSGHAAKLSANKEPLFEP